MSVIVESTATNRSARPRRTPKAKPVSRETQQLRNSLEPLQDLFEHTELASILSRHFQSILKSAQTPITRIVSLGLGSLRPAPGQTRRLKQLTILLAIRDELSKISRKPIEIFAQDPAFTRADETFLSSLGISILRTTSGAHLGDAADALSSSTLVYSPFLTIEAYEQLLVHSTQSIPIIVGDDFNALAIKWPKHSAERRQVEGVMKAGLSNYKRKLVSGVAFWEKEDEAFPMAVYEHVSKQDLRIRSKI